MKKFWVILVIAIMASSMVYANGSKESAESERKELTMWFWGTADFQRNAMQKNLIDAYNNSQNEYKLVVEFRNSVDNDVNVAVSAGQGPDIVYGSGPSFVSTLASGGKLANLDSYAEKYGWKDRVLKPMYDACSYNGSLYSIPGALNTLGVFYNKKVLADLGFEPPKTIGELENIMDVAMSKGLYASVTGAQGWRPTNENYTSLVLTHSAGPANTYKALKGEKSWSDPEFVHAMEKIDEWYKKGYLAGKDYFNLDFNAAAQFLVDGRSPFFIGPTLVFQFIVKTSTAEQAANIGFIPFPNFNEDLVYPTYTLGTVCSFSINETSKNKDAAAAVLDLMLTPEFTAGMTETWPGYWGMPVTNLKDADMTKLSGLSKTYFDTIMNVSDAIGKGNFGYFCGTFFPPSTLTRFYDIDAVWTSTETAGDLMKSIDKIFTEELKAGLVPPIPAPAM